MAKFDDITGRVKEVGNDKTHSITLMQETHIQGAVILYTHLLIVFENLLFLQTFIICGSEVFRRNR